MSTLAGGSLGLSGAVVLVPLMAAGLVASGLLIGLGWAAVKGVDGAVWAGGKLRMRWSAHCAELQAKRERYREQTRRAQENARRDLQELLTAVGDVRVNLPQVVAPIEQSSDAMHVAEEQVPELTFSDSGLPDDVRDRLRTQLSVARDLAASWSKALEKREVFNDPAFAAACIADAATVAGAISAAEDVLGQPGSYAGLATRLERLRAALSASERKMAELPRRTQAVADLDERVKQFESLLAGGSPGDRGSAVRQQLTAGLDALRNVKTSLSTRSTDDIDKAVSDADSVLDTFFERLEGEHAALLDGHVSERLQEALAEIGFGNHQISIGEDGLKVLATGEGGRAIKVAVDRSLNWHMATQGFPGKTCEGVLQRLLDALRRRDLTIADEDGPVRERFSHQVTVQKIIQQYSGSSEELDAAGPEYQPDGSVVYRLNGTLASPGARITLLATQDGWADEDAADIIGIDRARRELAPERDRERITDG